MHLTIISTVFLVILRSVVIVHADASTSLYIPDDDPTDPDTALQVATQLGVGSDGRTTWIVKDASTTDFSDVPVTLVEGPNEAQFSGAVSSGSYTVSGLVSCTITNSQASCVETDIAVSGSTTTTDVETFTESAVPTVVQLAGSSSSGASAGSSPASAAPQATGTGKNSAAHPSVGILALLIVAGSASLIMVC